MAEIVLKNINKVYENGFHAVKNVSLDIRPREFIIFVGPSGCGKSTLLRLIAGLEEITSGELWMDGMPANFLEPKERNLSMVFQNYALYPQMTVYKNLAFSLEIRGLGKREIKKRVEETAGILGLEQVLDRRPKDLSGGQRQRVAIGNAIIRNPEILLMDEPLSNLDAKLRGQMRVELAEIHKSFGNTMLYVTHDQTEAMTLGTRIVVMNEGEIQQADTPKNLYDNPINRFVAGFIGSPSMNFLECGVAEREGSIVLTLSDGQQLICSRKSTAWFRKIPKAETCIVGIRPENLLDNYRKEKTYPAGSGDLQKLIIRVTYRELLGHEAILHFELAGTECRMKAAVENPAKAGDIIPVWMDMDAVSFFDRDSGENMFYRCELTQCHEQACGMQEV